MTQDIVAGTTVVRLEGRLDTSTAILVEDGVLGPVRTGPTVIDLAATDYVSSAGLRIFLKAAKAAKASGHPLALAGLSPSVAEIFEISGFTPLFTIVATVEDASAHGG